MHGRHLVHDRDAHWHRPGYRAADRARDGRIMTAPFAVVGAGPSGLGCAAVLAAEGPVVLIDRIPVPGGTAGWDGREIRGYVTRSAVSEPGCGSGRPPFAWDERAPARRRAGRMARCRRALFVACGLRPATLADLNGHRRPPGRRHSRHCSRAPPAGRGQALVPPSSSRATVRGPPCRRRARRWAPASSPSATTRGPRSTSNGRSSGASPAATGSGVRLVGRGRPNRVTCDGVVLAGDPAPPATSTARAPRRAEVTFVQPLQPLRPRAVRRGLARRQRMAGRGRKGGAARESEFAYRRVAIRAAEGVGLIDGGIEVQGVMGACRPRCRSAR